VRPIECSPAMAPRLFIDSYVLLHASGSVKRRCGHVGASRDSGQGDPASWTGTAALRSPAADEVSVHCVGYFAFAVMNYYSLNDFS
jgi:hypothetical protein